jgi:LysM repeat protein
MKKVAVVLALAFVLVIACTTQPKPAPTPAPASAPASIEPQTPEEAVLKTIYDRYRGNLILDGAAKYTVVSGDMLSRISRTQYDNGFYFPVIMLASTDVVLDPDKIEPGMVLTIPDLQRNLNDANARANIKNFLGEIAVLSDERHRPQDAQGLRALADSL